MSSSTKIFTKEPEKNKFFNFQISWKILLTFFTLFFIFVICPGIIYHINKLQPINAPDTKLGPGYGNFLNIVYFCYFLFVINYFIFVYNICIYYARVYRKGPKGAKGDIGETGGQGENVGCDICTTKTSLFKRREDLGTGKEIVDNSILRKLNEDKDTNKWVGQSDGLDLEKLGASDTRRCNRLKTKVPGNKLETDSCDKKSHQANTYFTGAVVGFDKLFGNIHSLQFMEDGNLKPNKHNVNNVLSGGYEGRLGDKKIGMNNYGESDDFNCPPGAGIYRIDTITDNTKDRSPGISGIKFYCRDIETGKDVKSKNSKNEIFHGIYFGNNPNKNAGGKYKYESVSCPSLNAKPSFMSGYDAIHGKKINGLQINRCSYFDNNQEIKKE